MNHRPAFATASLAALVLSGCASAPPGGASATALDKYVGALTAPQQLEPIPGQAGAYRWLAADANLKKYNKVILDRIQVRIADDAENKSLDPIALAALVEFFRQSIVTALGSRYPVVEHSGSDVLEVRITLVDIVPNNVALTGGLTVVAGPIATVMVSEISGEPKGAAPYMGRTAVAAEFLDSQTGRLIGEYADTQFGQQYSFDQSGSSFAQANLKGTENSFSKWSYVHQAFDVWAKQFRVRLDQAHGQ